MAENSSKKKVKAGDLLVFGNQYFLALGEKLSFSEQYDHLTTTQADLVYKGFLSAPALKLFHWMVETYYTTYKSVVRLFFADDIEKLLERETKVKGTRDKGQGEFPGSFHLSPFTCSEEGQTLIVFPDLRTMFNTVDTNKSPLVPPFIPDGSSFGLKGDSSVVDGGIVTLLSSNTQNQKDVHRWEIKKGMKSVIICTYAEIFQDFHDLKKIIFIDPHKWYYAAQQDPRYKVGDVIEEMKKLYGAEVEVVGV